MATRPITFPGAGGNWGTVTHRIVNGVIYATVDDYLTAAVEDVKWQASSESGEFAVEGTLSVTIWTPEADYFHAMMDGGE